MNYVCLVHVQTLECDGSGVAMEVILVGKPSVMNSKFAHLVFFRASANTRLPKLRQNRSTPKLYLFAGCFNSTDQPTSGCKTAVAVLLTPVTSSIILSETWRVEPYSPQKKILK